MALPMARRVGPRAGPDAARRSGSGLSAGPIDQAPGRRALGCQRQNGRPLDRRRPAHPQCRREPSRRTCRSEGMDAPAVWLAGRAMILVRCTDLRPECAKSAIVSHPHKGPRTFIGVMFADLCAKNGKSPSGCAFWPPTRPASTRSDYSKPADLMQSSEISAHHDRTAPTPCEPARQREYAA